MKTKCVKKILVKYPLRFTSVEQNQELKTLLSLFNKTNIITNAINKRKKFNKK